MQGELQLFVGLRDTDFVSGGFIERAKCPQANGHQGVAFWKLDGGHDSRGFFSVLFPVLRFSSSLISHNIAILLRFAKAISGARYWGMLKSFDHIYTYSVLHISTSRLASQDVLHGMTQVLVVCVYSMTFNVHC